MNASHARKARREAQCPLCPAPITIGERVVKIGRHGSWMHRRCFLARYRTTEGANR